MGGGIIGLEMGTVYDALGSEVEVVEMFDQVIPAADKDVVGIYTKQVEKKFKLMLETKVTAVEAKMMVSMFQWKVRHATTLNVMMQY